MRNSLEANNLCFVKKKKIFIWPKGYKTFFMLNLTEHEIFHANKS